MSEEKKGIADAENSTTTETMADYARELEASFRTIREGDVISGTVIDVRETGVTLDLGYYAPAVIKTEDLSRDPSFPCWRISMSEIRWKGLLSKETMEPAISRCPA